MRLGYNTSGFAFHTLGDALLVISEIGYKVAAVTIEKGVLDPPDSRGVAGAVSAIRDATADVPLPVTIETGSRFLLDPRRKHQPTLLSGDAEARQRRFDFLRAAIEIAAEVSADSVSLWSGRSDDDAGEDELWGRLVGGVRSLAEYASARGVRLAFEPEPEMFIDTMEKFERLLLDVNHRALGLTLDVGHVHCLGDGAVETQILQWRNVLWNVHIEDMRRGVHEHLPPGEGEMDFAAVFSALRETGYAGPIHVELSRHSHDAVIVARRAFEFLSRFL